MKKSLHKKSMRAMRVEKLEARHMLTSVVINEIHFDPDDATEQVEFIELYNDGPAAVDLSGWVIDEAVDFVFPTGTTLASGDYAVVTQNSAEFQTKYGVTATGQWEVGDKLSNSGENIQLRDSLGQIVDEVDYQLGFPWPTVGENGGSIELINPAFDNNLAGSWRISSGDSGLPQTPQTLLAAEDDNWSYRKGTSEASTPIDAWREPTFVEDASWMTGETPIGYGDGDDNTVLNDMRTNYTSIYLRNTFTITGAVPNTLLLRVYVDDGAAVWINNRRVALYHVEDTELAYNDLAFNHDASSFEERVLVGAAEYLTAGENTIAIHTLNSNINSSDLSIDAEVIIPAAGANEGVPTPGAENSVFSPNAAPQLRQLKQSVEQPTSGEDVIISIKATDPDGVQGLSLDYQLVDPGNYIRLTDSAYQTNWTTIAMNDDGLNGDAVAGDDIYSVTLPGSLQTHRRLVRYRITATDTLGEQITGPFADDPQPNFAYFVYDGVPDYTASLRPEVQPNVTYSGDALDDIATYHLIANSQDVNNSQYNGSFNLVQFNGTLVYDGIVYDHIEFRNRGRASTYQVGKNKWKLNFLRGHSFQARDNYGNRYNEDWDKINILPGTNPWWRNDVSTEGTVLWEPVAFKLYELAGTPSPHTQYFQFRVIDSAAEVAPSDQYGGDFWGLYIGIEQPDGRFLNERGLPDGNIFNMHSSTFGATSQRNQGSQQPTDRSDLQAFRNGIDGGFESLQWWEDNLNLDSYFAWNLINHAVNNSDIRPDENVNYYHNQETDQWHILPWDLDLTFEDAPHWFNPVTNRENIRAVLSQHASVRIAYENRLRELQDLLFNSNDAALVVEELAGVLTLGSNDTTIVQANQAQWDYHPRKVKKGIWHDNFDPSLLPSEDFAGLTTYLQDFISPGGYGYQLMADQGDDSNIPNQPILSYLGEPSFPRDGLTFQTTAFSDPQGVGTFDAMEWRVAEVHNASVANYDPNKPYLFEVEGTWESGELSTFASQVSVPENAVEVGKTYRARVRMRDTSGRWSHWSDAEEFLVTPALTTAAGDIVISEINYNPYDPTAAELAAIPGLVSDKFEFIEVVNVNTTQTVNLLDYELSGGVSFTFGNVNLAPGERAVIVENVDAFTERYGSSATVLGAWSGGLSNKGEQIILSDSAGQITADFTYGDSDPWAGTPDGNGATLELIDLAGTTGKEFDKYYSWQGSAELGGTPGSAGIGPNGVVINEVLAHTDLPSIDAIELFNTTEQTIDIGGWFLSDSSSDFLKFEIPAGTMLGAGQYLVFDEDDFNPTPATPGPLDFALDADGDDVYLMRPDGSGSLLFVDQLEFGASFNGESFGRVPNGSGRLAPLTSVTLGAANSAPRIDEVVISEVNYHPEDPTNAAQLAFQAIAGGIETLIDNDLEFVEIHNSSASTVDLTDWRIRGESDFDFAPGTMLVSGGSLLVVTFDPSTDAARLAGFIEHYSLQGSRAAIIGGLSNHFDNGTGRVELQQPDNSGLALTHVTADEVLYDDLAPWPLMADGDGESLQRLATTFYGNAATSWQAVTPTPGTVSFVPIHPSDFDANGEVDGADLAVWEGGFGAASGASSSVGDADQDGDVDGNDFLEWQRNLGASSLPVIAAATSEVVQQPQLATVVQEQESIEIISDVALPPISLATIISPKPFSEGTNDARDLVFDNLEPLVENSGLASSISPDAPIAKVLPEDVAIAEYEDELLSQTQVQEEEYWWRLGKALSDS